MMHLFDSVSQHCSKITTQKYSTSFSSAITLLHKSLQNHIYNIYGFVRFADEIVDTFHQFDKASLLQNFKKDTYLAIDERISINPILQSFQITIHQFNINRELIDSFFHSMEMDLNRTLYNEGEYQKYIYGSAEVVGLMCLHVFCEGSKELFDRLKPAAQSLGAAFQKVNFLRDLSDDHNLLNRVYFPNVDFKNFSQQEKENIQKEIALDFENAYHGIKNLPVKSRFGVYVAYKYYLSLFRKIKKSAPSKLMQERIRINNYSKAWIVLRAGLRSQLNIL